MQETIDLESFFVYKKIGSSNEWGVSISSQPINSLPNLCFGMQVQALHEKDALFKAKELYENLHKNDSHLGNVKDFLTAIAKNPKDWTSAGDSLLSCAVKLSKDYEKYKEKIIQDNK